MFGVCYVTSYEILKILILLNVKKNTKHFPRHCSSHYVYWTEPAESSCAMVGHLGDGGVHAVPSDLRAAAWNPRMYQWPQTKQSVLYSFF